MDDAVGLVEALGGSGTDVRPRSLVLVEPGDVGGVEVDLGVAVGHPFGNRLADPRPLLDPHRCHRPQALHLRGLAQHGQPVGCEGQQPVDGVLHAHVLVADDLGHQLQRMLHLLLEVGLGEGELGRREGRLLDRGDLVGIVQDRAVGVGADLQPAAVGAVYRAANARSRSASAFRPAPA